MTRFTRWHHCEAIGWDDGDLGKSVQGMCLSNLACVEDGHEEELQ